MENVCKNENFLFKILPCLLIAMIAVMCLFGSNVYAASYTSDKYPNSEIITPTIYDEAPYHLIYIYNSGNWQSARLIFSDSPFKVNLKYYDSNGYCDIEFLRISLDDAPIYMFEGYRSDGWDFSSCTESDLKSGSISTSLPEGLGYKQEVPQELLTSYIVDCNLDIYEGKDNTVVFQAPPQKVEGITIPAIQTAKEIPQRIVETVKIILPIFLAIFGVLLFLSLIKSKNLLHL